MINAKGVDEIVPATLNHVLLSGMKHIATRCEDSRCQEHLDQVDHLVPGSLHISIRNLALIANRPNVMIRECCMVVFMRDFIKVTAR